MNNQFHRFHAVGGTWVIFGAVIFALLQLPLPAQEEAAAPATEKDGEGLTLAERLRIKEIPPETAVKTSFEGSDPVACWMYPDANTVSGGEILWGPKHFAAQVREGARKDYRDWMNLYAGEFRHHIVDLQVRGRGLDFVWSRSYRAQEDEIGFFADKDDGEAEAIGWNWDHSYHIFFDEVGGGQHVTVGMGMNEEVTFEVYEFVNTGDDVYWYYSSPGWSAILVWIGQIDNVVVDEYELRWGNGVVWEFEGFGGGTGAIGAIRDRYGNTLQFSYDGLDRLQTITDALGRNYTLSYGANGLLSGLIDFSGRTIVYTYYIASETLGPEDSLKRVDYPDAEGADRYFTYTYAEHLFEDYDGNLLNIADGRGNTVLTNTYYTAGTADILMKLSSQSWTQASGPAAVLNYYYESSGVILEEELQPGETKRTLLNDGVGNVTEFYFDADNHLLRERDYTRRADADEPTTGSGNRPSTVVRAGDPAYFDTKYTWNTNDLMTTATSPRGNQAVYTYDSSGDPELFTRLLKIERYEDNTQTGNKIEEVYGYTGAPLPGCRCGEQFYTSYDVAENEVGNYAIDYAYDTPGNLIGIDYAMVPLYSGSHHETFGYNSFGQVTEHKFPENDSGYRRRDTFSYYPSGAQQGYLQTHTMDADTAALVTTYSPDAVGNVETVIDARGHDSLFDYNAHDEVIEAESRPVSATVTASYTTLYVHDANGNVQQVDVENRDKDGNLLANTLLTTTFQYTPLNQLKERVEEVDAGSTVTTQYEYDLNGNLKRVKTPLAVSGEQTANTIEYSYDERDLLFKVIRANARTTQYDYDANGNPARASVEGTHNTLYAYDLFDRLRQVTDPEDTVTQYVPNALGLPLDVQVLEPGSVLLARRETQYDLQGKPLYVSTHHFDASGPLGVDGEQRTSFTYADTQAVDTVIFEGAVTDYDYDTMNRLARVTDPEGNYHEYTYDANSNVTQDLEFANTQVPGGADQQFVTGYEYDFHDRLTKQRDKITAPSGTAYNDTVYAYDSRDNLVYVQDPLGETTYAFDGLDRQTGMNRSGTGGFGVSTGAAYDKNSRLIAQTDPLGHVTQYAYDALDRQTATAFADGTVRSFEPDIFGNPEVIHDPSGRRIRQSFDNLNRVTQKLTEDLAGFGSVGVESFAYDGLSRLTSAQDEDTAVTLQYDSLGNVLGETQTLLGGTARTVTAAYNNKGNREALGYPGGRSLTLGHDGNDRLTAILEGFTPLATYAYVGPRVGRRTYGNGTQLDVTYNGVDGVANAADDLGFQRVAATLHSVTSGGAVLDSRTYQWDGAYNKKQRKDTRSGGPLTTFNYTYDPLSRLTQSAQVSGPTVGYTLDDAGNRTAVDNNGTPEAYTLDTAMNQYTATPGVSEILYDDEGNLSSSGVRAKVYTYDVHDRLTGYIEAAGRTLESFDGSLGAEYEQLLGTWAIVSGSLRQTDAATAGGRILKTFTAGAARFAFSYKTTHDPADPETYDPEYYALALLRVDQSAAPEWRYLALAITPHGLSVREWKDDALLAHTAEGEIATADVTTEANTWYEVEVRYGTGDVEVYHAKRGNPFPEDPQLKLEDLTVTSGSKVGFGVGTGTDYAFDNLIRGESAVDIQQATFQYDALGRRIAKSEYTNGTLDGTTLYYYDGDRVVEERDAATGNVLASYVYGNYVDEVLQMQRGANTYYYHADDLYNVTALTDTAGAIAERYDYTDFGQPTATSSVGNPFFFNGQSYETDLGLYHYRSRYMNPSTGRFLQSDSIGPWGDSANLGNAYAYAGNNPWTAVDPYGQWGIAIGSASFNIGIGDPSLVLFGSDYFAGAIHGGASGIQGMVWTGPKELVGGFYNIVRHPVQTIEGVYALGKSVVTEPGTVAGNAWEGVKSLPSNPERIGALTFDAMATVATAGASKAVLAPKAGRAAAIAEEAADAGAAAAKTAIQSGTKGVHKYEVGTFEELKAQSLLGDALDIHHVGQAHPMEMLIPEYNRSSGPAIALPHAEHAILPALRGPVSTTPRGLLARDIHNLRNLTDVPNPKLQQLIDLNKRLYPEAFKK